MYMRGISTRCGGARETFVFFLAIAFVLLTFNCKWVFINTIDTREKKTKLFTFIP